eukprot:TRINITY_DN24066_c0_g1_i1.p1 TRINITY_DN24066_c0_g1~~TRINITY_DN24066_c0_g1_i1.p1  ORF type:complete len:274 (-),score=27.33 TRINITY_DN24066_c0_g1_i1:197-1018(-)
MAQSLVEYWLAWYPPSNYKLLVSSAEASLNPAWLLLFLCIALAPLGKFKDDWIREFVGVFALILSQLAPGVWIGTRSRYEAYGWHAASIVFTDIIGRGAHLNPSVSLASLIRGSLDHSSFCCRVAAQVSAGILGHMVLHRISSLFDLPQLSGPALDTYVTPLEQAIFDEAASTWLLCTTVFILQGLALPSKMWLVCELVVAAVIRLNLEIFNSSGPAMNPMMGTSWAIFAYSQPGLPGRFKTTQNPTILQVKGEEKTVRRLCVVIVCGCCWLL